MRCCYCQKPLLPGELRQLSTLQEEAEAIAQAFGLAAWMLNMPLTREELLEQVTYCHSRCHERALRGDAPIRFGAS